MVSKWRNVVDCSAVNILIQSMIKAEQLYEDIVFDNQYFNVDLVVEEYLPDLLKNNSGGLPMYKYLKDYKKEVYERVKDNLLKYTDIDKFLNEILK